VAFSPFNDLPTELSFTDGLPVVSIGATAVTFDWITFTLCWDCISRNDADPLGRCRPPHAGPSGFGTGGDGISALGGASSAPLRNMERPPFFAFFLDDDFGVCAFVQETDEAAKPVEENPEISLNPTDEGEGLSGVSGSDIDGVEGEGWLGSPMLSSKAIC